MKILLVTPAQAGVHVPNEADSRFRGNDVVGVSFKTASNSSVLPITHWPFGHSLSMSTPEFREWNVDVVPGSSIRMVVPVLVGPEGRVVR
jgi:hypothetical protein